MNRGRAIFITRSDIGWYSKNANVYRKALEVATKYNATLYVSECCRVPSEIARKYCEIVRFHKVRDVLAQRWRGAEEMGDVKVFTGFDFPSMYVGWRLKKKYGCHWTLFLWDPPSLSHRDRFLPLTWIIDLVFRFFAKRCDRLVLNIHSGLLEEIGYKPREGQLELRMQDAWAEKDYSCAEDVVSADSFMYDFGVLSNWSKVKGGEFMMEVLQKLHGKKCLWIGDEPKDGVRRDGIVFTGKLPQEEAFERLRECRILVVPYLPVPSLKWNYPLKMFEYLDLGHPIIASDNPGNAAIAKQYPGKIKLFHGGSVDDFIRVVEKGGPFT